MFGQACQLTPYGIAACLGGHQIPRLISAKVERSVICFSRPPQDAALSPHQFECDALDDAFLHLLEMILQCPPHEPYHDQDDYLAHMASLALLSSTLFPCPYHVLI